MKKIVFWTIPVLLLIILYSCKGDKQTDFSNIQKDEWFSGKMPNDSVLFLSFKTGSINQASGECFFNNGMAVVSKGSFKITKSKQIQINISEKEISYEGRFFIQNDTLIFQAQKPIKSEIIFTTQMKSELRGDKSRYKKKIFSRISKNVVTYGKADGFYASKKVDNMNMDSYS